MVTVSDKKLGQDTGSDDIADYYEAIVTTASDYYPFGWQMPNRKLNAGNYSFGFNGQLTDSEWMGGQSVSFEFRTEDPRIGRFLSTDPLTAMTPWETPYAFAGNSPISQIDWLGLHAVQPAGAPTLTPEGASVSSENGQGATNSGANGGAKSGGQGAPSGGGTRGAGVAGRAKVGTPSSGGTGTGVGGNARVGTPSSSSTGTGAGAGTANSQKSIIDSRALGSAAARRLFVFASILRMDGTEWKTEYRYPDFPFAKLKSKEITSMWQYLTPLPDYRWTDFTIPEIPIDFWVQTIDKAVYNVARDLYSKGELDGDDPEGGSWIVYKLTATESPLLCKSCVLGKENSQILLDPGTTYKIGIAQWEGTEQKSMSERYKSDKTINLNNVKYEVIGKFNNRDIARSFEKLLILQYKYSEQPLKLQRDKNIYTKWLLPTGNAQHN